MSSDIWTQCAGRSSVRPLALMPWRVVESQHQISTRVLVDTLDEQALLEAMIDGAKPPEMTGGKQHYLLFTPFRYPPLRHGSRFGDRLSRGIWYGAMQRSTAFAEVAYYRLVFLEGTTAELASLTVELSAFRVRAKTARGVDLSVKPFARVVDIIASPTRYDATQALGAAMRADNVAMCVYPSARDPERGNNVAVFSPTVFGRNAPRDFERWSCVASRSHVDFGRRDYGGRATHQHVREAVQFARSVFLVGGGLPAPALS